MPDDDRPDSARQIANLAGALFQIAGGGLGSLVAGVDVGRVSDETRTLVVPAGYAFAIWGPIFALCLAYALSQALPARRRDPVLRRIGGWTAGAFLGNGVWEILFPNRLFAAAQILIVAVTLCAVVALLRLVAATRHGGGGRLERWLIASALGLLAGWLTAATLVGLAATLVARGWAATGTGAALGGGALLLFGGGIATAIIAAAKPGPTAGWLGYGAAVLWALAAVIANQYDDSLVTAGATAVAAALVLLALVGTPAASFSAWRGRGGLLSRASRRDDGDRANATPATIAAAPSGAAIRADTFPDARYD